MVSSSSGCWCRLLSAAAICLLLSACSSAIAAQLWQLTAVWSCTLPDYSLITQAAEGCHLPLPSAVLAGGHASALACLE